MLVEFVILITLYIWLCIESRKLMQMIYTTSWLLMHNKRISVRCLFYQF